MHEFSTGFAGG